MLQQSLSTRTTLSCLLYYYLMLDTAEALVFPYPRPIKQLTYLRHMFSKEEMDRDCRSTWKQASALCVELR
jgi:hypothetical protein